MEQKSNRRQTAKLNPQTKGAADSTRLTLNPRLPVLKECEFAREASARIDGGLPTPSQLYALAAELERLAELQPPAAAERATAMRPLADRGLRSMRLRYAIGGTPSRVGPNTNATRPVE
jgi:hypothetical protein